MSSESVRKLIIAQTIPAGLDNQHAAPVALVYADGTQASTIKKQATQVDSVASTVGGLVTDFNALLAKLRLGGVIS